MLAVALALGCRTEAAERHGKLDGHVVQPYPVVVYEVPSAGSDCTVQSVGILEPFERRVISSKVAGVVEQVNFREGDKVESGTVLAAIEPEKYRLAVVRDEAILAGAVADRGVAERQLAAERMLAKHKATTELNVLSLEAELKKAQAQESQARSQLKLSRLTLADSKPAAPITGVIQTRSVEVGQHVQPGTKLASMVLESPLQLRFSVLAEEAGRIAVGQVAQYTTATTPRALEASIVHVSAEVSRPSGLVEVLAQAVGETQARPGQTASVTLAVAASEGAVVVPADAVLETRTGTVVFLVENEVGRRRAVRTGLKTLAGKVEVLSGLRPGELVVSEGADALTDGARVRVTPAAGGAPRSSGPSTVLGRR